MTSYVKRVGDLTDEDGFVDCTYATEASANPAFDPVTKPSHYAGHTGIDCKSAMESMLGTEAYVSHMQACAFKYIWRWRDKNGIEDLKKARECIGNMIRAIEGDGDE